MENVIVTGGCGFIGSNFIRLLLKETRYNIICVDSLTYAGNKKNVPFLTNHKRLIFRNYDICDRDNMQKCIDTYKPRYLINFAAESHVDRSIDSAKAFIDTNISGTYNLLDICMKSNIDKFKFIHVSTDEVYGSIEHPDSFTEESPFKPNSPYAASKASSDLLCRSYYKTYGFPVIITNCSNNYGAYQHPEKFIPTIISKCMNDEPIPIYGDGLNVRDWIYVDDHCRAVLSVMEKGGIGETYNIGASTTKTNMEIVETITDIFKEKTNKKYELEYVTDRLGHDQRYAINSTKIMNTLNWKPQIDFNMGIQLTIKWYQDNKKWYQHIIDRKKFKAERLGLQGQSNEQRR